MEPVEKYPSIWPMIKWALVSLLIGWVPIYMTVKVVVSLIDFD